MTTYTERDDGSKVRTKVGDQFMVALGGNSKITDNWNMQTGYGLSVVTTTWDPTQIPRPPTVRGADGTETWTLQTTKPGTFTLDATCFGKGQYGGVLSEFQMVVVASKPRK